MIFFKRKREIREDPQNMINETALSDPLVRALLGDNAQINRDTIMSIPAISACINKIADVVSMIPIRLYKKDGEKIEEITDDNRLYLLNHETGDTLDSVQFKKALVTDMFLGRGGYAYVHKVGTQVKSLHYVECEKVSFWKGTDPIFKDCKIQVNGRVYERWQFIRLLRNSRDGLIGKSIIEESSLLWSTVYNTQLFEEKLVKTGGNKKGFLQSASHLSEAAMTSLKNAFRNLYRNNTENVIVLNDGVTFKESGNTSVEMQLNENKKTNGDNICKVFLIPPSIINGGATEGDRKTFHEECILPILSRLDAAINSVMLREDEKDTYFFACDTDDLLRGDIEKRYNAYQIALASGFMQLDEVRKREKLPAYNLNFIKLGLQDVLLNPETNEIYTPNTNKMSVMGQQLLLEDENNIEKGGENDDKSGNQG